MNCINCDNPIIENKELQLCASCNLERRKAERNSKKVKVVHQVKKVSESKAAELKEYAILKKQFLETKMACEIRLPGCFMNSFEVHHCSISESNFLNTNTWLAVCRNCHSKIETEMSAESRREQGLLTD